MLERAPGIFEVELHSDAMSVNEIKIFLIPGTDGGRSLMVDAGFRRRDCLKVMEKALGELGIACDMLDVFLTHRHHDHCGLASEYAHRGARLFMNPQEDRHCSDCLYYSHSHGAAEDQPEVLRSVGITREGTPEVWNMFMEANGGKGEKQGWEFEIPGFSSIPVKEGHDFSYGAYHFKTVALKGHTFGQMGLVDRESKVMFCADQVIEGIVPIVDTTYPEEHLLKGYFESLEHIKHDYEGFLILPAHNEPIKDTKRVVDRIVFSYLDKAEMIKGILDHGRRRLTAREVACLAYGMEAVPRSEGEFIKLKMIINKTFSCLEYLFDVDLAIRVEEEGIIYWEAP